jgi:hypothetical protein
MFFNAYKGEEKHPNMILLNFRWFGLTYDRSVSGGWQLPDGTILPWFSVQKSKKDSVGGGTVIFGDHVFGLHWLKKPKESQNND